jgi:capsular polysaccharide biosynthesis protein
MNTAQENRNFDNQVDLKILIQALLSRWPLFAASFLVGGILLFAVSQFLLPKMYLSSIELFVNNTDIKSSSDLTSGDIDASQKLANTYIVILKNPAVLGQVAEEISDSMTVEDLSRSISMGAVENTEVVRISATTKDPALSTKICNAYADIAPEVLERVVQAGSVEIIGAAAANNEPVSPNVLKNTAIGALAALFIALVCAYIAFAFDNTVKGGFDLRQRFDVPVLGEIPSFPNTSGRGRKK